MSEEIYFSNNYRDLSNQNGTGAGFQFEFSCSRCSDTWRSPFEPFRAGQMAGWLSRGVNAAWQVVGGAGRSVSDAAEGLAGASFGSQRDAAFTRAIATAQGHFQRCPRCTSYVCTRCWNPGQGLCLTCSPDTAAEAQAAQQRGLNDRVTQRAYDAGQQRGDSYDATTPRQLVCPHCRTETRGAAFCPACGHRLAQMENCSACHQELPDGAAFCPSCGARR
ncbi:zinc ribbon domain-containing protein [Streptomyces sp. SID2888]|uniref:zinc ribbon domain-containing protein n=1 Tax=Streptomyces TaxID=1883 RepID=UPI00136BA4E4|nr:zinc ribbon domain-containing protein [Streptomyces sp. SID2888]MYV50178.1 zinc ribbon domain-containing protein [Streptomyces sp. SID2888]